MDTSKIEVEINPDYTMMKKVKDNLYLSQEQIDNMTKTKKEGRSYGR